MRKLALAIILAFAASHAQAAETAIANSIVGRDGVKMVHIPAGLFIMGTEEPDIIEMAPKHKVYTNGFYMDEHLVTNRQFAKFLNTEKPAEGKDGLRKRWIVLRTDLDDEDRAEWWPTEVGYEYGKYVAYEGFASHPVITVSWEAADAYCRWVGKRLPTEAEWEKAARGGQIGKTYPWGDEQPVRDIVFNKVWLENNTPAPTRGVKVYHPNDYGLYDMAGQVWQWCFDWFDPTYYKRAPLENPRGPESGWAKAQRGGAWNNPPLSLRVAMRNYVAFEALDETSGFRCVMDEAEALRQSTGGKK